MKSIKCPLIADKLYSKDRNLPKFLSNKLTKLISQFKRQALHSKELAFSHPYNNELLTFTSEIPNDMKILDKALIEDLKLI